MLRRIDEINNKLMILSGINKLVEEIRRLEDEVRDKEDLEEKLKEAMEAVERLHREIDSLEDGYRKLRDMEGELRDSRGRLEGEIKTLEKDVEQYESYRREYEEARRKRLFLESMKKFLYGERRGEGRFYKLVDTVEKRVRGIAYEKFKTEFIKMFLKLIEGYENIRVELDETFKPIYIGRVKNVEGLITQPSGGQLTSVSLAYRLALNTVARSMTPQLKHSTLILDEPTYGFSPERIEKLRELLRDITRKNRQILIVTHDRNLLDVGDCRIKLSYNEIMGKTLIEYEGCRTLIPEYVEFVRDKLSMKTTSFTQTLTGEEAERGFKPEFRKKSRGRSIFDYM